MQHSAFLTADTITVNSPSDARVAFARESEGALESMIDEMDFAVDHPWSARSTTKTEQFILGVDGNPIQLSIYRPADQNEDFLPAVLYLHGGGMVMLKARNRLHTTYAEAIAQMGVVAIIVDFRNVLCSHHDDDAAALNCFPAGLNDCVSAVKWVYEHKQDLRVNKIVLHGDSGGGNLALATAIKLHKDNNECEKDIITIDGVFAVDPYISGAYDQSQEWKQDHLLSLVECDGYDVSCSSCSVYARLYDNHGKDRSNSLAWPYWISETELRGLPPHIISVAELDPLRDEGMEYCRKLVRANVRAVGRVRLGLSHTGDLLLRQYVPDEFVELLVMLRGFVDRLSTNMS